MKKREPNMQDTENKNDFELDKGEDWSETETDEAPDIKNPQ